MSASKISLLACPLPRRQRQRDIGGGVVLITLHARTHNPCSVLRYRRRGGQHYHSSGAWRLPPCQSKTRTTNRRRRRRCDSGGGGVVLRTCRYMIHAGWMPPPREPQPIDDDKRRCDTGGGGIPLRGSRALHSSSYLCQYLLSENEAKETEKKGICCVLF